MDKKLVVMLLAIWTATLASILSQIYRGYHESCNQKDSGGPRYSPRLCMQNPFAGGLDSSLHKVSDRMDNWLRDIGRHHITASNESMGLFNHDRYFPFEEMALCEQKGCIGGPCGSDESKIVCALHKLRERERCIIYSIGSNNQWQFEEDLLKKTPCEIHTFDCTGRAARFHKPNHDRIVFHHVCLGTQHEEALPDKDCRGKKVKCGETWTLLETQQRLNHTQVDLFKMDVEGYEWRLFESWPAHSDPGFEEMVLPMQLLVEVHYRTQFAELRNVRNASGKDFRHGRDMVNLHAHLLRLGYFVAVREDSSECHHCTELTLIRSRCPATSE